MEQGRRLRYLEDDDDDDDDDIVFQGLRTMVLLSFMGRCINGLQFENFYATMDVFSRSRGVLQRNFLEPKCGKENDVLRFEDR